MHSDGPKVFCPTSRRVYHCIWTGPFSDLKRHTLQEHSKIILRNNQFCLNREFFYVIYRGYVLKDETGNLYYLNVCYHIDGMLYFNVVPTADECEKRKYRLVVKGVGYEGEIGPQLRRYARVPCRHILKSMGEAKESLKIAFEFV